MNDEKYMMLALNQAKIAYKNDEVPVGAIVVKNGEIISEGFNRKEMDNVSIRHAEMIAIEKACLKLNSWRLEGCTLYCTLEPCMMCMGAILESRISKVVFGCSKNLNNFYGKNVQIYSGVKENECLHIMQTFFENKR